jgi:uncharacterized protein YbjT (DUF2867 family)
VILVTGATGKVGSAATHTLAAGNGRVRALVRDPAKATAPAQSGAELAIGDFGDAANLDKALAGVSTVVLVSPAVPARPRRAPSRRR